MAYPNPLRGEQSGLIVKVDDVAAAIYGETRGVRRGSSTAEAFEQGRAAWGHVYLNREEAGNVGMVSARPNPNNPVEMCEWQMCQSAARRALMEGEDPTHGALYINIRPEDMSGATTIRHGRYGGEVSAYFGPFNNVAGGGDARLGGLYFVSYYGVGREPR